MRLARASERRQRVAVRGLLVALAACAFVAAALAQPASAARTVAGGERLEMLRAAAASSAGIRVGLRVGRGGRVTFAPLTIPRPASVLAVRSSIDRSWALVIVADRHDRSQRRSFLLQRRAGRWIVRASAGRGEEGDAICRIARPATAVVLDLGLSSRSWSRTCRHPRERRRLVRPMTAGELRSVRAMVEWRMSETHGHLVPGPVQPAVRDRDAFASDCSWDGRGKLVAPPVGEVARADRRWGAVIVSCSVGSDGFGVLESATMLLVARNGRSGPFTRVLAHTHPSWSMRTDLCARDRRWPIPARARVALEFCTPVPAAIRNALR